MRLIRKGSGGDKCGIITTPQTEGICSLIPRNPYIGQRMDYEDERLSVYACSRKRAERKLCQDTVAIYISNDLYFAGIFDGYEEGGDYFSRTIAKKCLALARTADPSKLDSVKLLEGAVELMLSEKPRYDRGTTATVALVRSDGEYSIASVGDSAAFEIGRRVKRLLDFDRFYDTRDFRTVGMKRMKDLHFTMEEYDDMRRMLAFYIDKEGIQSSKKYVGNENPIETAKGKLVPGSTLMLASDGITKNLLFRIDSEVRVIEISGCSDIESMLRDKDPSEVGKAVFDEITMRLNRLGDNYYEVFYEDKQAMMLGEDDISVVSLAMKKTSPKLYDRPLG